MKFLVIQTVKQEVPMTQWAKLLPLQFKYFDQLQQQNLLEVAYHLIGQQGSMLIINADSDETLSKVIGEDPMFFHLDRQIYPLTTLENHEKRVRTMLQQATP